MGDHRQETKVVKKALKDAGIVARVSHGAGTGYGWLRINVGDPAGRNGVEPHPTMPGFTRYTIEEKEMQNTARRIAMAVTGRRGAYNGEILILAQEA